MKNTTKNAEPALAKLEQIRKSALYSCIRAILSDFAYSRFPSIYFWTEHKTGIASEVGTPKWSHKKPEGVLFYKLQWSELVCSAGDDSGKDFAFEVTKFLSENL